MRRPGGGTEAMEKLKGGQEYDAVTLDLLMPDGNGVAFLRKLLTRDWSGRNKFS